MGLLGILKPESDAGSDYEVEAMHFNLWVLPTKRLSWSSSPKIQCKGKNFYIDVGMRIKLKKGSLNSINIHFPCKIDRTSFCDLSDLVKDEKINDLIFGTVATSRNNTIEYPGDSFAKNKKIKDIVVDLRNIETNEDEDYTINFSSDIEKLTRNYVYAYLRFRVGVKDASMTWASKGWGSDKFGAIFDLRVSDAREGKFNQQGQSEVSSFMPINRFFGFLIVPASFVPVNHSPPLHYSRLLEPNIWKPYLEYCRAFSTSEKFAIHQWRSPANEVVNYENPFRAYMHLHREFGTALFFLYVILLVAAALVGAIISESPLPAWLYAKIAEVGTFVTNCI